MKTILLITAVLLFSFKSNAQLAKGRMLFGGNINYNQNKNDNNDASNINKQTNNSSSFGLQLRYGCFVTNNIAVGLFGGYQNVTNKNEDSNIQSQSSSNSSITKNTSNTYSGGLFTRYYKMIGQSKFAMFGQLSFGYGAGAATQSNSYSNYYNNILIGSNIQDKNSKTTSYTAALAPGIVYFINNKFGIETIFGNISYSAQQTKNYNQSIYLSESKSSNSSVSLNLGSISVGVYYYFGGSRNLTPQPK